MIILDKASRLLINSQPRHTELYGLTQDLYAEGLLMSMEKAAGIRVLSSQVKIMKEL